MQWIITYKYQDVSVNNTHQKLNEMYNFSREIFFYQLFSLKYDLFQKWRSSHLKLKLTVQNEMTSKQNTL